MHQPHHIGDAAHTPLLLPAEIFEAKGDVLLQRHVREQRIVLEDGVDAAPVRRQSLDIGAAQTNFARCRLLEAGDHPQKRCLAAAGGAEHGEEFVLVDIEADRLQGLEMAIGLRYTGNLDGLDALARIHGDGLRSLVNQGVLSLAGDLFAAFAGAHPSPLEIDDIGGASPETE